MIRAERGEKISWCMRASAQEDGEVLLLKWVFFVKMKKWVSYFEKWPWKWWNRRLNRGVSSLWEERESLPFEERHTEKCRYHRRDMIMMEETHFQERRKSWLPGPHQRRATFSGYVKGGDWGELDVEMERMSFSSGKLGRRRIEFSSFANFPEKW